MKEEGKEQEAYQKPQQERDGFIMPDYGRIVTTLVALELPSSSETTQTLPPPYLLPFLAPQPPLSSSLHVTFRGIIADLEASMAGLRERFCVEKEGFEPRSVLAPTFHPIPVKGGPREGGEEEEEEERVASSSPADERDAANNASSTSSTSSTSSRRHGGRHHSSTSSRPSLAYAKSLLQAFREFR